MNYFTKIAGRNCVCRSDLIIMWDRRKYIMDSEADVLIGYICQILSNIAFNNNSTCVT